MPKKTTVTISEDDGTDTALSALAADAPDERLRVIAYRDLGVAPIGTAWNGPQEVAKADVDKLRVMCAWYDAEKADAKSAYKLPHHKAGGGHKCVWNGVRAAMGAMLGARGGVAIPARDRKGVYNHLKKHYAQFERDAPEFRDYEPAEIRRAFPELFLDPIPEDLELDGEATFHNEFADRELYDDGLPVEVDWDGLVTKRSQITPKQDDLDEGSRQLTARISAVSVDSEGDVVMPKGMIQTRFRKHPVVLFNHDYRALPVGKNVKLEVRDEGVYGTVQFPPEGSNAMADALWSWASGGFPLAASIGLDIVESTEPTERDIRRHPEWAGADRIIGKWLLWEWSLVTMPANEDAVVVAVAKALADGRLTAGGLRELGIEHPIAASRVCRARRMFPRPWACSVTKMMHRKGLRHAEVGRILTVELSKFERKLRGLLGRVD